MRRLITLLCTASLLVAGCGERRAVNQDGALPNVPGRDAAGSIDLRGTEAGARDLALPRDQRLPDQGGPCTCAPGQVWLRSDCVPTDRLGCGWPCSAGASCPPDQLCDPCAATPGCFTSSCAPACVPTMSMGMPSGALRVSPTAAPAGQPTTFTIRGGRFYIGALWWEVRLGDGTPTMLDPAATDCSLKATLTPGKPGLWPLTVSYGGYSWSLAGFVTVTAGSGPGSSIQPGYPCSWGGPPCASAAPYSCSCQQGRCGCTPRRGIRSRHRGRRGGGVSCGAPLAGLANARLACRACCPLVEGAGLRMVCAESLVAKPTAALRRRDAPLPGGD